MLKRTSNPVLLTISIIATIVLVACSSIAKTGQPQNAEKLHGKVNPESTYSNSAEIDKLIQNKNARSI